MNEIIVNRLYYLLQDDRIGRGTVRNLITAHRIRRLYKAAMPYSCYINHKHIVDDFNKTGNKIAEECIVELIINYKPYHLPDIILRIKRHSKEITKFVRKILEKALSHSDYLTFACISYLSRFKKRFVLTDEVKRVLFAINRFDDVPVYHKITALVWSYRIGDKKFRKQLCRKDWSGIGRFTPDEQISVWEARFLLDAVTNSRSRNLQPFIRYLNWILILLRSPYITHKAAAILYKAIKVMIDKQPDSYLKADLISRAIHPNNPESLNRRLIELYDELGNGFNAKNIIMLYCDFTYLGFKLFKHYLAKNFLSIDDVISLLHTVNGTTKAEFTQSASVHSYMPNYKNKFYLTAVKYLVAHQKQLCTDHKKYLKNLMLIDNDFARVVVENGLIECLI